MEKVFIINERESCKMQDLTSFSQKTATNSEHDVMFTLPKSLYFAWLLRDDIRGKQSIGNIAAQKDFLIWWLLNGRHEYPQSEPLNDTTRAALFEPLPDYPQYGYFGICRLLRHIYSIRPDIQALYKLNEPEDIIKLNQWFYLCGLKEHKYLALIDKQTLQQLNKPSNEFCQTNISSNLSQLSPLMFFVRSLQTEPQQPFDLNTQQDYDNFLGWFCFEGVDELDIAPLISNEWVQWLDEPIQLNQQTNIKRLAYLAWQYRPGIVDPIVKTVFWLFLISWGSWHFSRSHVIRGNAFCDVARHGTLERPGQAFPRGAWERGI